MSWAAFVRAAKLVALLGFVLPWVVLSCSSNEIASVSGLDLAAGRIEATNPLSGEVERHEMDPSVPIIAAFSLAIAGLVLSFLVKNRLGAAITLSTSLLAFAASYYAVTSLKDAPERAFNRELRKAEREGRSNELTAQVGAAALRMIRVEERPGYWITLAALAAAAGFSGAGLAGRLRRD